MLDINKLRNAYNVIHRMSQNRHPFAEEELSLEVVQSAQVQEALTDRLLRQSYPLRYILHSHNGNYNSRLQHNYSF